MSQTIKLILLFLFMSNISFMAEAQQKSSILLTNYTFSRERNKVGRIVLNGEPTREMKLGGENAASFEIREGMLFILSPYNLAGAQYEITISADAKDHTISNTFRIIDDQFIRNKVIAHRGAWKNTGAPENSIAALKHAVQLGCGGSEFDVHMSADSVLVVNHDPSFQGKHIERTVAEVLLNLLLPNGEKLPSLESYLKEGISEKTTKLILEIKPSAISKERGIATARKVFDLVHALKAQAWVDYISFDYDICKELLRLDPFARVAYLDGDKAPAELKKDGLWGYDYHFNVLRENSSWIQEGRNAGLMTNAWTVNDENTMHWLLDQGIDFITTNEPETLLDVVNQK